MTEIQKLYKELNERLFRNHSLESCQDYFFAVFKEVEKIILQKDEIGKSIKEQNKEIKKLKQEIEELKRNNLYLKARNKEKKIKIKEYREGTRWQHTEEHLKTQ